MSVCTSPTGATCCCRRSPDWRRGSTPRSSSASTGRPSCGVTVFAGCGTMAWESGRSRSGRAKPCESGVPICQRSRRWPAASRHRPRPSLPRHSAAELALLDERLHLFARGCPRGDVAFARALPRNSRPGFRAQVAVLARRLVDPVGELLLATGSLQIEVGVYDLEITGCDG